MLVPAMGGGRDRLADGLPSFKAPAFGRQGAKHFPPGLDEVEIRCVLRLKDELPARVSQREEQDIGGVMQVQVIQDRIDPLAVVRCP